MWNTSLASVFYALAILSIPISAIIGLKTIVIVILEVKRCKTSARVCLVNCPRIPPVYCLNIVEFFK